MNNLNKILIGAVVILSLLVLGMTLMYSNSYKESKKWEHNYKVAQDSVNVVQTKYGETLYENGSLIIKKKELEDALGVSQKQVRDYEKKLNSKLAYIAKLESKLEIKDTIKIKEIVHDTLTNSYSMGYKDEWLGFNENFSLENPLKPRLEIYNIWVNLPLKVGLTDDYTIFVTSPNPYLDISKIEGAVIDGSKFAQKPKRWGVGLYVGWGVQYGMINKQLDTGPQIGGGIEFKLF